MGLLNRALRVCECCGRLKLATLYTDESGYVALCDDCYCSLAGGVHRGR